MSTGRNRLSSAEVAQRMGIARSTLHDIRTSRTPEGQKLRSCILRATKRSTWWSAEKLRALGYLASPTAASQPDVAITIQSSARWAL